MQLDAFLPIIYDCPFPEFADPHKELFAPALGGHSLGGQEDEEQKNHAPEKPPLALVGRVAPATPSQQRLEKLRADANYCALMSKSATDPAKRERFRRLAEQLALEALELEQIVKEQERQ